jgi:hypothetical protein
LVEQSLAVKRFSGVDIRWIHLRKACGVTRLPPGMQRSSEEKGGPTPQILFHSKVTKIGNHLSRLCKIIGGIIGGGPFFAFLVTFLDRHSPAAAGRGLLRLFLFVTFVSLLCERFVFFALLADVAKWGDGAICPP